MLLLKNEKPRDTGKAKYIFTNGEKCAKSNETTHKEYN